MTDSTATSSSNALLCPFCGFDLRATPGDRCGECGEQIDRDDFSRSGYPWAHRVQFGWVRAYVRTVWLVTFRSSRLRRETIRPQDWRDGRSFARLTGLLLTIAVLLAVAPFFFTREALDSLNVVQKWGTKSFLPNPPNDVAIDLVLPWSAGVTIPGVAVIAVIALCFYFVGMPRSVIPSSKRYDLLRRERTSAIAYYASAPLALVALAGSLCAICIARSQVEGGIFLAALVLLSLLFAAAGITLYFFRMAQWRRRVTHGGIGAAVIGVVYATGLALFGLLSIGGLFVWLCGFIRIVIASWN